MTYANAVLAHVSVPKLKLLQNIPKRLLLMATGCPWYVRNIDLHRNSDLLTICKFMKDVSRRYFDVCPHHSNPSAAECSECGRLCAHIPRFHRLSHLNARAFLLPKYYGKVPSSHRAVST
jgi:hypothetical protein